MQVYDHKMADAVPASPLPDGVSTIFGSVNWRSSLHSINETGEGHEKLPQDTAGILAGMAGCAQPGVHRLNTKRVCVTCEDARNRGCVTDRGHSGYVGIEAALPLRSRLRIAVELNLITTITGNRPCHRSMTS